MKLRDILLGIIAVLLAMNVYYTYHSALVFEKKPTSLMTDQEFTDCLADEAHGSEQHCKMGWYLKGSE